MSNQRRLEPCRMRKVLKEITSKWSLVILFKLDEGPLQFGQLHRQLEDISKKVLTENLHRLTESKILERKVSQFKKTEVVSYSLTSLGKHYITELQKFNYAVLDQE